MAQKIKTNKSRPGSKLRHAVELSKQAEEAKRAELTAYCWSLYIQEYSLREIAAEAVKRFDLKSLSHIAVRDWINNALAALAAETKTFTENWRAKTLALTARLKKSWFAKALHETEFAIARLEKVNGGAAGGMTVEVIDEEAFKERAMAVDRVLKILEQERRILGVGLATTENPTDATTINLVQMNTMIMQAIGKEAPKPGGLLGAKLILGANDPGIAEV